jgi:hypothetical protein
LSGNNLKVVGCLQLGHLVVSVSLECELLDRQRLEYVLIGAFEWNS